MKFGAARQRPNGQLKHGFRLITDAFVAMLGDTHLEPRMIDRALDMLIDTSLLVFGALILALLYVANEIGFYIGSWQGRQRPAHERDLAGIGTITAGMLGLLAFTLGLTINIAQARFEARRNLVVQEANAVNTAWMRSKLIAGDEGPKITALVEAFAQVELAYVSANSFDVEPDLIAHTYALQAQIWEAAQSVARRDPSSITASLTTALINMFDAAVAERFAFESRVPADLSWMLLAGSLLAIGAMGYHLGASGSRQVVLTALLLVMWAGAMVLIADLNRPRTGAIRVDPAPLMWTLKGFGYRR
jgi:hypothetical protein